MPEWSERTILDALYARFSAHRNGSSRRYLLAEHVGLDPVFPRRILDLVIVDTYRSTGFGLHGFEVKTSRSDLRRELNDLSKAAAFEEHLDTFTIVAPADVLRDWKTIGLPEHWGVMLVHDSGLVRYARAPRTLSNLDPYERAMQSVPRHLVASLMRAGARTEAHHTRKAVSHA